MITVKGPKGELKQAIDRDIKVEVKDDKVEFDTSYRPDQAQGHAWIISFTGKQYGKRVLLKVI